MWFSFFARCREREKSEQEVVALASQCPNLIYVNRSGLLQYHSNRADVVACIQSLDGRKTQDFFAALGEGNENHPVSRLNSLMHTFSPDALVETLIALEKALLPRVILANYIFMTRGLPLLRTGALTIVDTIDVFSTKAAKVSAFGIEDALAMSRQEEGALLARADVALAIQAEEAEELRQIAPKTKVLTVGVDMPKMSRNHGAKDKKIILLVASEESDERERTPRFFAFFMEAGVGGASGRQAPRRWFSRQRAVGGGTKRHTFGARR